jgi:histidinol-phosphate aminotransferase
VHGSFDASAAAEVGLPAPDVLDFSANGNVLGPPPGVVAAIAALDLSRYPDRGSAALRAALSRQHGVPEARIVPGNGSTELIWAVARAFLAPGGRTLVVGPTYGEYAAAAAACGARVDYCQAIAPGAHADVERIARAVADATPRVVWLCHPNNPTGKPFPLDALAALVEQHRSRLFVVDEAYLTLSSGVLSALPLVDRGNVVVLRSMTKDAALAGIRIGYAVAAERIADALRRVLPPWSVSAVAQAAALVALDDRDFCEQVREAVRESREHLSAGLRQLGYYPHVSVTNFVLVPVGDAGSITRALLSRGVAVRDCTSFGLPDCIRIGVRATPDQARLLEMLAEVRDG